MGSHGGNSHESSKRKLLAASLICGVFMVVEIAAGLYAGSLAIITDAAHMLSDLCSFGISLASIYMSQLPPTDKLSFGYQRAEMVGAFISIMIIWLLTIWLVIEALRRLWNPAEVRAPVMIVTAAFGILSNVAIALILSGDHHHHHHHHHNEVGEGSSHEHHLLPCSSGVESQHGQKSESNQSLSEGTPFLQGNAVEGYIRAGEVIKRLSNPTTCQLDDIITADAAYVEVADVPVEVCARGMEGNWNVMAAYLHTLGDLLQNVGVAVAGVLIYMKPNWTAADPVCTLVFAAIVVCTTLGLIQEALMLLMEGVPRGISAEAVAVELKKIPEVSGLHDLHIWSLGPGTPAMACHLVVEGDCAAEQVLECATSLVQRKFHVLHTTIQVDSVRNKAACETDAHEKCQKNN
ncbi:cation efflux family protein [Gregarina niphandrodes]|uniref:Cation efflux family protein n=1 Tax=Gregarina niphandrodes TaxID=110365 RepID=A0A023B1N7_GRENI|nr:cation efflux family protein [Gregarina niphandrodes]EZG47082.1 cation efflux family protein [Gregarina niphandrodes]|eukprot:XP_011132208.1 cation efflux family protein [Gregarina niphandrodes]